MLCVQSNFHLPDILPDKIRFCAVEWLSDHLAAIIPLRPRVMPLFRTIRRIRPDLPSLTDQGPGPAMTGVPDRKAERQLSADLSRWDNEGGALAGAVPEPASLRILVVDSDPLTSLSLAMALANIGHTVCASASTVDHAVNAARYHSPDLIIMDASLGDDRPLIRFAPVIRILSIPRMFNDGMPLPRALLPPGCVVVRRPFHARDLARVIRQALAGTTCGHAG